MAITTLTTGHISELYLPTGVGEKLLVMAVGGGFYEIDGNDVNYDAAVSVAETAYENGDTVVIQGDGTAGPNGNLRITDMYIEETS